MTTLDREHLEILTFDDMAKLFKVSKQTIRRRVADGGLPPPVQIGSKSIWHREAVEMWIIRQHGGDVAARRKRDLDELC